MRHRLTCRVTLSLANCVRRCYRMASLHLPARSRYLSPKRSAYHRRHTAAHLERVPTSGSPSHTLAILPSRVLSSVQLMPSDLKFDPGRESLPMFVSDEENVRIEAGSEVRVKIIGIRLAAEQIVVIGTIKEDFLG